MLEKEIAGLIEGKMTELGRFDLYRPPLVASSPAENPLYLELKEIVGEWHLLPTDILPDAKTVISYFIPFTKQVAASPAGGDGTSLWGEAYVIINDYFDIINRAVCGYLHSRGYSACPYAPVEDVPEGEDPRASWARPPRTTWSHRSGAAVAGLGTFGVNRLLITAKGSAGRFSTIFTSALLDFPKPKLGAACPGMKGTECGLCVTGCPTGALTHTSLDYAKCSRRCIDMEQVLGREGATVCGRCISVCPLSYIE